jgi:hypothetical protein
MKLSQIAIASAVARIMSQPAEPPKSPPNWLQRLASFTVHPKVPQVMRDDVKRLLAERETLLEFYNATSNYIGSVGQQVEGMSLEDAVALENKAEARMAQATEAVQKAKIV